MTYSNLEWRAPTPCLRSSTWLPCAVAIALALGCGPRRAVPAPVPEPATAPAAAVERPSAAPTTSWAPPRQPTYFAYQQQPAAPSARGSDAMGDGTQGSDGTSTDDANKPRDLSAELTRMLGGLSDCLQPRAPDKAATMLVSVTVYVTSSGAVSRAEVNGSQLQDDERGCLRRRAEAVRFKPIDNAPLAAHASLQLTPKVSPVEKQTNNRTDSLGMVITQAPSGPDITPGVVPPESPGVVPPADPGVPLQADPGVIPTPDPPAEVLGQVGAP